MSRSGAITFKGNPMTLAGEAVAVGQPAPAFTAHYFKDGFQTLSNECLQGKPSLISVIPSIDTGVCQTQTKKFNEEVAALGDAVNAVTISLDLPFAQNRWCGAEGVENLHVVSDYQDRSFGNNWGMLIEELKLLARGAFVVDAVGTVQYAEVVGEATEEPNYDAALEALKGLL
ncbi:MAG: lipid hydroperoxide peroxidase [Rhodopirellula sp.]|jgi:thiol peroxidase|nr:lipid hydroperoxide peroxidase [Rhodopirellula sp.]|tara:strand:- start:1236 stop:1754 length:519 start_codon:yes stop_codon:yes gene_type:complete